MHLPQCTIQDGNSAQVITWRKLRFRQVYRTVRFVCLFVCLFTRLLKNACNYFHDFYFYVLQSGVARLLSFSTKIRSKMADLAAMLFFSSSTFIFWPNDLIFCMWIPKMMLYKKCHYRVLMRLAVFELYANYFLALCQLRHFSSFWAETWFVNVVYFLKPTWKISRE